MRVLIADESVERAQRRDEAANARLRMLADRGSESLVERGEASASRSADGTLVIRLAGPWHLQGGLPSPKGLQQELHGQPPSRVAFDATALRGWDSSLVNFLVHVVEPCQERGVPVDQEGLPSGVRRLIALAEAVPERKG